MAAGELPSRRQGGGDIADGALDANGKSGRWAGTKADPEGRDLRDGSREKKGGAGSST